MIYHKVGAPKGLRVHWFLIRMPQYLRSNYYVGYDYEFHNYFLFRRSLAFGKTWLSHSDFFTVVRTSRCCWRMTAYNVATGAAVYESARTSTALLAKIERIARQWHDDEPWQKDKEKIEKEGKK